MLGTAGLPHILIRFYTVPTAARRAPSVQWAIGLIGSFYLMTLVLGFGAAALLDTGAGQRGRGQRRQPRLAAAGRGRRRRRRVDRRRRAARADLRGRLRDDPRGGRRPDAHLGVVGGARPLRQRRQEGHAPARSHEIKVARIAAFVIGGIAIVLAIPAQKLNIAFLVALAFAVAASANLPSIIYNLFWRRFNTRGATWSIYGGLVSCVGLVFFSPVVSGKVVDGVNLSLLPASVDFSLVPAGEPRHRLDPARLPLRLPRLDHLA